MIDVVKITDHRGQSHNGFAWTPCTWRSVPVERRHPDLCTDGVIHCYLTTEQALLNNPIQGTYDPPVLWLGETPEIVVDDGTKAGVYELRLTRRAALPSWYRDQRSRRRVQVQYAILCAEAVLALYEDRHPNDSRPRKAIEAAKAYFQPSTRALAAAYAAVYAATSTAATAAAAGAAVAAHAAAYTARAAHAAAYAAVYVYAAAYGAAYTAAAGAAAAGAAAAGAAAAAHDAAYDAAAAAAAQRFDSSKLAVQAVSEYAAGVLLP